MKKATKIKIGVSIGSVVLVIFIISITLNIWIKALVCRQLDHNIATADSFAISYEDIRVSVLTGKAWIKNAYFCSDTAMVNEPSEAITECKVDMLSLDGINYFNWLVRRQLNLRGLTVVKPNLRMRFYHNEDEVKEGDVLQEQMEKARTERLENMLRVARVFIDDATLSRLTIDHANVKAEAINDSLRIEIPEFTMNLYDLGYNIKDSLPHYNDSVFHLSLSDANVCIPKAMVALTVRQLTVKPSGLVEINDVWIKSDLNPARTEYVVTGVKQVTIGGFNAAKFNKVKQMDVKNIHLYQPYANLCIDETIDQDEPSSTRQKGRTKEQTQMEMDVINKKLTEANVEIVTEFITGLTVDTILFHDGTINVTSVISDFHLQANRIAMAVYGAGFSLIDKIPYHYNDSVYQLSIGNLDVLTPDSVVAISAQNIDYDDGGAFSLGKTHIYYTIDKWDLAPMFGNEPLSMVDMWIDSVHTSSKNIVKEARTLDSCFFLDTLYADVRRLAVFRDERFKSQSPYLLPQAVIMQVDYPFVVNCVKANVQEVHVELALTKHNVGSMDLGPVSAQLNNVTARRNAVISATAQGKMGKADISAMFDMKVNKACEWEMQLNATHLNTHHLDSFIYPLVGMKIGCDIHRLRAQYGGDTALAKGTFCMEYDDIDIFADKNSNSPFVIVKDLSGLINSAGKTLVNPSNPSKPGKTPVAYRVKWKNDPMVDPSLFYIGPVIDGCIETMLPGLFLHRRVKDKNK